MRHGEIREKKLDLHRIGISTDIAHCDESLTAKEACLNSTSASDDVLIGDWANGNTSSPARWVCDLSTRWEGTVVRAAYGAWKVLVVLEVHLHAITSSVLEMDSK